MKKQALSKVITIFCVTILLLTIIPIYAKGIEYIEELSISITNSPNEIEMNSNETENLTIEGIVHCEMYGVRNVIVFLQVSDTFGHSVIDPTSITFSGSGIQEESFEITAQIPPLSEGEYTETITVEGIAQTYPGTRIYSIEPQSVDISIRVINETINDSPDVTSDENNGFTGGYGIMFIVGVLTIIIFILVIIWIIKRRKQKSLEIC